MLSQSEHRLEKNFHTQSIAEWHEFYREQRAEIMFLLRAQQADLLTGQGESILLEQPTGSRESDDFMG